MKNTSKKYEIHSGRRSIESTQIVPLVAEAPSPPQGAAAYLGRTARRVTQRDYWTVVSQVTKVSVPGPPIRTHRCLLRQ